MLQKNPTSRANGFLSPTVSKSSTDGSPIQTKVRYRPRNASTGASLPASDPWLAPRYSGGEASCTLNLSTEHSYDVIIESSPLIGYNETSQSSSLFIPKQALSMFYIGLFCDLLDVSLGNV